MDEGMSRDKYKYIKKWQRMHTSSILLVGYGNIEMKLTNCKITERHGLLNVKYWYQAIWLNIKANSLVKHQTLFKS